MLSQAHVAATVPCSDFDRAKKFYGDVLGLTVVTVSPGAAVFECGAGTRVVVYPTKGAGEAWASVATFEVADLEAEMKDLRARGVTFEDYDLPGLKTVNGIADSDGGKAAWFKDSEGNTICVVSM